MARTHFVELNIMRQLLEEKVILNLLINAEFPSGQNQNGEILIQLLRCLQNGYFIQRAC